MNVQATHVIPMLPVLTMKVLLTVHVMLGTLETDLIVLVSKSLIHVYKIFHLSSKQIFLIFIFYRY